MFPHEKLKQCLLLKQKARVNEKTLFFFIVKRQMDAICHCEEKKNEPEFVRYCHFVKFSTKHAYFF